MKLPRRYFILACLLLGAIGVPWAWRTYQARRVAEIERLESEFDELSSHAWFFIDIDFTFMDGVTVRGSQQQEYEKWTRRIQRLQDRLEKLTGVRPLFPEAPKAQIGV